MGNHCKSVDRPRKFVEPQFDRIFYKTADNNQHNITDLLHNVVCTNARGLSKQKNRDTKKSPLPLTPMTEFINLCSKNRPAGIPDTNWDRFVSSICLECSWIDVQGEVDKIRQVEAETSSSRSSYRPGKKDSMVEEASERSTPTASDPSLEFAGKFLFTEVDTDILDVDTDESNDVSKSRSSLSAQSLSTYRPDRSFAQYYSDLSIDDEVPSGYDKKLDLKYALSLGDIPCNAFEGIWLHDENQISSKSRIITTDLR